MLRRLSREPTRAARAVTEGNATSPRDSLGRFRNVSKTPAGLLAGPHRLPGAPRGSSTNPRGFCVGHGGLLGKSRQLSDRSLTAMQQARGIPREASGVDRESPRDSSSTHAGFRVGSRSFGGGPGAFYVGHRGFLGKLRTLLRLVTEGNATSPRDSSGSIRC
jgi:hypothetical protein